MKKRFLSLLLCCVMLLGLMPTAVFAEGSTAPADITGEGTAENPYLIYTAAGLNAFRDKVNGQNGLTKQPGAHAKLMNDIVLNDGTFDDDGNYTKGASGKAAEDWTPIGMEDNYEYSGTFDGDGHTIKGLYVTGQQKFAGLFGCVKPDTKNGGSLTFAVKNLTVTGYIGINSNSGTVAHAGGIVGCAKISAYDRDVRGTISNCVSHVVINARHTNTSSAGGIVGRVNIMNSKNHTGNIEITNCANHAAITAHSENGNAYAGGIVGHINESDDPVQKINSCFNAGKICASSDGSSAYAGGIVGSAWGSQTDSSIANCLNVGEVTGVTVTGSTYAGGIAGIDRGVPISNCCNVGKVGENGGGIANHVDNDDVSNCYYLEGTADMAYNGREDGLRSKAAFADGTVLNLLQNGDENSPWERCDYLKVVGMMLPLLKGQADDTFRIYTAQDLKTFRTKVNAGETSLCAKLMNDIVLNDGTFDADGNYTKGASGADAEEWTPINGYTGTFDGHGYTIKGLYVTGEQYAGLFASLSGGSVVKNLTVAGSVEASNTDDNAYAGGIAARMGGNAQIIGSVNNATVKATVNNDVDAVYVAYAGGMAGHMGSSVKITGSTNNGTVAADSNMASAYTGGMAGYTEDGVVIENCLNSAELSAVANCPSRYLSDGVTEYDKIESKPLSAVSQGSPLHMRIHILSPTATGWRVPAAKMWDILMRIRCLPPAPKPAARATLPMGRCLSC